MEAALSERWSPENTCSVSVLTPLRGHAVKQVSSSTANHSSLIFFTFSSPSHRAVVSVKRSHCYEGIGLYYKGTAFKTVSGQTCVEWDEETRKQHLSSDVNSGKHNYCRSVEVKSNISDSCCYTSASCMVRKNICKTTV